jgi:hypothetical protein
MLVLFSSHLKSGTGFESDFDKHYDNVYKRLCQYYGKQIEFCSVTTINLEGSEYLSDSLPEHTRHLFQFPMAFPRDMINIPINQKPKSGKYDIIWVTDLGGMNFDNYDLFDEYCTKDGICFYCAGIDGDENKQSSFLLECFKDEIHKNYIIQEYGEDKYKKCISYLENESYSIKDPLMYPLIQYNFTGAKRLYNGDKFVGTQDIDGSIKNPEGKEINIDTSELRKVNNPLFISKISIINMFKHVYNFLEKFKQDEKYYIYKHKDVSKGGYYNKYIKYKNKYLTLKRSSNV